MLHQLPGQQHFLHKERHFLRCAELLAEAVKRTADLILLVRALFHVSGVAFTRVGISAEDNKPIPLYPCVGLRTPGEEVEVNFGQKPFVFNIEEYRKVRLLLLWTGLQTEWHILTSQWLTHFVLFGPHSQEINEKARSIIDQVALPANTAGNLQQVGLWSCVRLGIVTFSAEAFSILFSFE